MPRRKMMFLSLMPAMFAMNIRLRNWHHICNVQYSIITNVNGLMAKLSSSLSISLTTLWIYNTVILLDTNTRFYRAWSLFYTAVYQHVNMVRLCMSRCYNGYSTTLVRKKSCIQRPAVPLWCDHSGQVVHTHASVIYLIWTLYMSTHKKERK